MQEQLDALNEIKKKCNLIIDDHFAPFDKMMAALIMYAMCTDKLNELTKKTLANEGVDTLAETSK